MPAVPANKLAAMACYGLHTPRRVLGDTSDRFWDLFGGRTHANSLFQNVAR